jgi:hypothetical protein
MKFLALASAALFCLSMLVLLQFLQYGFLPGLNPNESDKGKVAMEVIFDTNIYLSIEILIGLVVLYFVNRAILQQTQISNVRSRQINWLILAVIFAAASLTLTWFSVNYYSAVVR